MPITIRCFVLTLKITNFVIMIENSELLEYRLKSLDRKSIVRCEEGETVYALESVQ